MLLYVNYGNNSHPSIIEFENTLHNTYFPIAIFLVGIHMRKNPNIWECWYMSLIIIMCVSWHMYL